jgi:hypothetical protein
MLIQHILPLNLPQIKRKLSFAKCFQLHLIEVPVISKIFLMKIVIYIIGILCLVKAAEKPVIGIIAYPSDFTSKFTSNYIAASYVKWIEAAGARVVPIPYNLPSD